MSFKARAKKRLLGLRKRALNCLHPIWPTKKFDKNIFVFGVQRSGTNMVMNTLDCSMKCQVFHDHDERAFDAYRIRSQSIIEPLINNSVFQFHLFKPLLDSDDFKNILHSYQPSYGIWVVRDYRDVVNSHTVRWTDMADTLRAIAAGEMQDDWRAKGLTIDGQQTLKKFANEHLGNESAVALFWYLRNQMMLETRSLEDNLKVVRYETLVANPRQSFESLFEWIGLPFKPAYCSHIHPRAIAAKAAPKVDPEIAALCEQLDQTIKKVEETVS